MKTDLLIIALILVHVLSVSCSPEADVDQLAEAGEIHQSTVESEQLSDIRASYGDILENITKQKAILQQRYRNASDSDLKKRVLSEARKFLTGTITDRIVPAWEGTRWSYNGHSQQPGEGSIACGFFVTTVLKHCGFNLDRIAMGRQPAEFIILNMTDEINVRRFSSIPVEQFKSKIIEWGSGLYIVGLDLHVGFIYYDGLDEPSFIHSSVYWPVRVVSEPLDSENPLKHSRYRVVGKILTDRMIVKWLNNEQFAVIHDYFRRDTGNGNN